jgi:hypothetical protein
LTSKSSDLALVTMTAPDMFCEDAKKYLCDLIMGAHHWMNDEEVVVPKRRAESEPPRNRASAGGLPVFLCSDRDSKRRHDSDASTDIGSTHSTGIGCSDCDFGRRRDSDASSDIGSTHPDVSIGSSSEISDDPMEVPEDLVQELLQAGAKARNRGQHQFIEGRLRNSDVSTCSDSRRENIAFARRFYDYGHTALALKDSFAPCDLLSAGFSLLDLITAGYDTRDLIELGMTETQLMVLTSSEGKLREIGHDISAVIADTKDVASVSELRQCDYSFGALVSGGYTAADFESQGYALRDLFQGGLKAAEFKQLRYQAADLKKAGLTPSDLRRAGYSADAMREAGYSDLAVRCVWKNKIRISE